ncbi:MAG TPA: hypothetical protein VFI02_17470 [Armatimonadota bacterium]|nr:hypothetical protein [Armatimonadota bacterium]
MRNPRYHPFLFALYPIIFLYAQNMDEASLVDLLRPAIAVVLLTAIVFLVLKAVIRDTTKAAAVTSVGLVMFFAYGHAMEGFFEGRSILGIYVGRNLVLFPIWNCVFLAVIFLIIRSRRKLVDTTVFLNIAAVSLLAMSLLNIGAHQLHQGGSSRPSQRWQKFVTREAAQAVLNVKKPLPDIYYLIVDEYAREDVLNEYFDHDNSAFLSYLRSKGFYVASKATSNYHSTYNSLASSLNFGYLDKLTKSAGIASANRNVMREMNQRSRVSAILQKAGYTFVFFASVWRTTNRNPYADVFKNNSKIELSEFDRTLISSSMLAVLGSRYTANRNSNLYVFDELERMPGGRKPVFVFAHITVPHPPFVFDEEGNYPQQGKGLDTDQYIERYVDQLTYLNKRLQGIIESILSNSETPPIIIIQGDHGARYNRPALRKKGSELVLSPDAEGDQEKHVTHAILNAYHFPNDGDKGLYDSISPVNTFRVLLNSYFGTDYRLLEDKSY